MKSLLWAIVILLVAAMYFAPSVEEAYDLHQIHMYELSHLDEGSKL